MEEQELTAELAVDKRRKWRGEKGREVKEEGSERKSRRRI